MNIKNVYGASYHLIFIAHIIKVETGHVITPFHPIVWYVCMKKVICGDLEN